MSEHSVEAIASIGLYELGEALGKGAFATVRLGRHMLTEEEVLVEFLLFNSF